MRPLIALSALLPTLLPTLATAKCHLQTPSTSLGAWRLDLYSGPNCTGLEHKALVSTRRDTCGCFNVGYFDCDFVGSWVWSPTAQLAPANVEFFDERGCKGRSLDNSGKAVAKEKVPVGKGAFNSFYVNCGSSSRW